MRKRGMGEGEGEGGGEGERRRVHVIVRVIDHSPSSGETDKQPRDGSKHASQLPETVRAEPRAPCIRTS